MPSTSASFSCVCPKAFDQRTVALRLFHSIQNQRAVCFSIIAISSTSVSVNSRTTTGNSCTCARLRRAPNAAHPRQSRRIRPFFRSHQRLDHALLAGLRLPVLPRPFRQNTAVAGPGLAQAIRPARSRLGQPRQRWPAVPRATSAISADNPRPKPPRFSAFRSIYNAAPSCWRLPCFVINSNSKLSIRDRAF